MVQGALRCMGTTQHLKNKFGAGYMLDIKLGMGQSTDWNSVEARLKKFFPGIAVDESFDDRRSYNIPKSGFTSISKAFSDLESAKNEFKLENYSFSQTTLEQVFLGFAKEVEGKHKKV